MSVLAHRPVFDVAVPKDWRWRTQDNLYLRPVVMETRHLHHTLVMIWHHTMPADARASGIITVGTASAAGTAKSICVKRST